MSANENDQHKQTTPVQSGQPASTIQPVAQAQPAQGKSQTAQLMRPVFPEGQIIIEAKEAHVERNVLNEVRTPIKPSPGKK
jgi:hypothetical protein